MLLHAKAENSTNELPPLRHCLPFCLILAFSISPAQQPRTAPLAPGESIPNPGPLVDRVDALKVELRQYHACTCRCGCYAKDLDLEADRAIAFLQTRAVHRRANEKLALVLDIDEATLSNWDEMSNANFEYDSKAFNAWIESSQAPAIPGTLRVYDEARKLGVSVFFVTGRPESERAATETKPAASGLHELAAAHHARSGGEGNHGAGLQICGTHEDCRGEIHIVLNVGDQWSDLRGKAEAEYSVKYPIPATFIN